MKCLVNGAAGFIGSHLCERLLADGNEVAGLDAFIPYYPRPLKEATLAAFRARPPAPSTAHRARPLKRPNPAAARARPQYRGRPLHRLRALLGAAPEGGQVGL